MRGNRIRQTEFQSTESQHEYREKYLKRRCLNARLTVERKARDSSAISSLRELLVRPEPSRAAASPSITGFPPLRQLYRPFLHWPIGPQNPVPSTTAISRRNHRARRDPSFFPLVPSARTMTTDVTLSLSARYFFLCSNSFVFLSDYLVSGIGLRS